MLKVDFVSMEHEEIKQSLIQRFRNDPKSPFKDYDFEGSALNYLIDMLAYITSYNNFYMASTVNELYLPYAQISKNVFALGKTLGYQPARKTAAKIEVNLKITDLNDANLDYYRVNPLVIPLYRTLTALDGSIFSIMENVEFIWYDGGWRKIKDGRIETNNEPIYIELKQGQWQRLGFAPFSKRANQEVFIPDPDIDNALSSIVIQDTVTLDFWDPFMNLNSFNLDKTHGTPDWDKFILALGEAKTYFFSNESDGVRIRFGDGTLGKIPENLMDIFYFVTDGIEGNGKRDFVGGGFIDYYKNDGTTGSYNLSNLLVLTRSMEVSTGGSDVESAESVRRLAPVYYSAQDRLITPADYKVFLMNQKIVPLENVSIISGDEMRPVQMGALGVTATKRINFQDYRRSDLVLLKEEKNALLNAMKERSFNLIKPRFLDPEFVSIDISGIVYFDDNRYEKHIIESEVDDAVNNYFQELRGFNQYFKKSNFGTEMEKSDAITHSNLEFNKSYYKLLTKENILYDHVINLGSPIEVGSIAPSSFKSTFLTIFNHQTYYPIKSDGEFVFKNLDGTEFEELRHETEDRTIVHKVFKYDILDIPNDDATGTIMLYEFFAKTFKSEQHPDNFDRIRFIPNWVFTGKKKEFGKINYITGEIQIYTQNSLWKFFNDNQKNLVLAIETERIKIEEIENKLTYYQKQLEIKQLQLKERLNRAKTLFDNILLKKLEGEIKKLKEEILLLNYQIRYASQSEDPNIEYIYLDKENKDLGYQDIENFLFYEYYFDEMSNIPVRWEDPDFVEISRGEVFYEVKTEGGAWKDGSEKMRTSFPFEFSFETISGDFRGQGNILILKGKQNIKIDRDKK